MTAPPQYRSPQSAHVLPYYVFTVAWNTWRRWATVVLDNLHQVMLQYQRDMPTISLPQSSRNESWKLYWSYQICLSFAPLVLDWILKYVEIAFVIISLDRRSLLCHNISKILFYHNSSTRNVIFMENLIGNVLKYSYNMGAAAVNNYR